MRLSNVKILLIFVQVITFSLCLTMSPRLLLLSNSTQSGTKYLEIWKAAITSFLKESQVKNITFIPFAGVTIDWNAYTTKVREQLTDFNVKGLHEFPNMTNAVSEAEAIIIGGGNTFHLLYTLKNEGLIEPIRKKVLCGTPYVGWSAGSNCATPDIGTTNDIPGKLFNSYFVTNHCYYSDLANYR